MSTSRNTRGIERDDPNALRKLHIYHDLAHEIVLSAIDIWLISSTFKDPSCKRCYPGETTSFTNQIYYPLNYLITNGGLLPSVKTYEICDRQNWRISGRRISGNIREVLYACRYTVYPEKWDDYIVAYEKLLKGEIPNVINVRPLSDLNDSTINLWKHEIYDALEELDSDRIWDRQIVFPNKHRRTVVTQRIPHPTDRGRG